MSIVTVTGGSDDLIVIGGEISEEFSATNYHRDGDEQEGDLLGFSDGTLLRIVYDKGGIWRITKVFPGTASFSKVEGDEREDSFDVVTLTGDIEWVVCGNAFARRHTAPTKRVGK